MWKCSINSCGQRFPKITEKKLNVESAVHCSKIRLFIYQFSGTMVSWLKEVFRFLSFVVDFGKVPKHWWKHFNSANQKWVFIILQSSLPNSVGGVGSGVSLVSGWRRSNLAWILWVEILAWVASVKNPHR